MEISSLQRYSPVAFTHTIKRYQSWKRLAAQHHLLLGYVVFVLYGSSGVTWRTEYDDALWQSQTGTVIHIMANAGDV